MHIMYVFVRTVSKEYYSEFPDTTGSLCRVDDLILERLAAYISILIRVHMTTSGVMSLLQDMYFFKTFV